MSQDFLPLNIAVLTASDTRTLEEDTSGQLLTNRLTEAGHHLAAREIVPDATPEDIRNPQDFPDLVSDTLFNYEDGILTGYLTLQTALRKQTRTDNPDS